MTRAEILAAIEAGRSSGSTHCRTCGGLHHQIITEKRYLERLARSATRNPTSERLQKVADCKAVLAQIFDKAVTHLANHVEEAAS